MTGCPVQVVNIWVEENINFTAVYCDSALPNGLELAHCDFAVFLMFAVSMHFASVWALMSSNRIAVFNSSCGNKG